MSSPRTHLELQELLGAFALDAVESDEALDVDRHLDTCPRCRNEVREHREVASLLAYVGTGAPAGLWDRLAAALEEAPPAVMAPPLALADRRSRQAERPVPRRGARIARLVAAAAVVAGLGAGGLQVQRALRSQNDQIEDVAEALTQDASRSRLLGEAAAAALADGARQVHLVTPDRRPIADAVILANGDGYLLDKGAPALSEDQTYQLWAVTGGQKLSLGMPGQHIDVLTFKVPDDTAALALTVEQAPGAITPRNQAVGFGLVQS